MDICWYQRRKMDFADIKEERWILLISKKKDGFCRYQTIKTDSVNPLDRCVSLIPKRGRMTLNLKIKLDFTNWKIRGDFPNTPHKGGFPWSPQKGRGGFCLSPRRAAFCWSSEYRQSHTHTLLNSIILYCLMGRYFPVVSDITLPQIHAKSYILTQRVEVVCAHVSVCTRTCMRVCVHTHTHTHTHTHSLSGLCTCESVHTYMHAHKHMHTNTHTHKYT